MLDGFEWAENKRLANARKHAVDFAHAALIFNNPVLEAEDTRHDYAEQRWRTLGRVADEYFVVVYTWRGSRRRIISAWKVGEHGRKRYQTIFDG